MLVRLDCGYGDDCARLCTDPRFAKGLNLRPRMEGGWLAEGRRRHVLCPLVR